MSIFIIIIRDPAKMEQKLFAIESDLPLPDSIVQHKDTLDGFFDPEIEQMEIIPTMLITKQELLHIDIVMTIKDILN